MSALSVTNRLLYKEFRVLRTVWGMCTVGVIALMVLVVIIAKSQPLPMYFSSGLWGLAIWIPPVYVLAALATMFAGEREEGSHVWLSVLAPPLGQLLVSKLLFVVVSGGLLQSCLALTAFVLSRFDETPRPHQGYEAESLFIMSFLLVEAVIWGWFWSLQTSKPLNAILYGALSLIVVNLSAAVITEEFGYRYSVTWEGPWGNALGFWGWGRLLLYAGVFALSVRMCDLWLAGRPWDWDFVARWWTNFRAGATRAVVVHEPREAWQRVWQRLRWLEWQSLKTYFAVVAVATCISCISLLFGTRPEPAFAFMFCWLAAPVAGVMAWQSEQSQSCFRALACRGVSPAALWLNKYGMWLLATLIAVIVIVMGTATSWFIFGLISGSERYSHGWLMHAAPSYAPFVPAMMVGMVLLWIVGQFTLAFACGHLFRKVVVSLGATMIGLLLGTLWVVLCENLGFPRLVFVAPLPVWLVAISWSHLPYWWVEQTSWRVSRRRGLELAALASFPAILVAGAMGYRVWEVPKVDLEVVMRPYSATPTPAELQRNIAQWKDVVNSVSRIRPMPVEKVTESADIDNGTGERHIDWAPWLAENRELLRELRDQVLQSFVMYPEAAIWKQVRNSRLSMEAFAKLAVDELAAGNTDESLQWLRASFRLNGARRTHAELSYLLLSDDTWRQLVYDWAGQPNQTEETLKRGLDTAAAELRFTVVGQTNVLATYQFGIDANEHLWNEVFWPWEEARQRRRLAIAAVNQWTYLREVRSSERLPRAQPEERLYLAWDHVDGGVAAKAIRDAWSFQPLAENPRHQRYYGYSDLYNPRPIEGLSHAYTTMMHEPEGRLRATITVMAVVGFRQLHGRLPVALGEVEPLLDSQYRFVLRDIWTKQPFGYVSQGLSTVARGEPAPQSGDNLPADALHHEQTKIIGPFLWSAGPDHVQDANRVRGELRMQPDRRHMTSGVEIFPIPPQTP